MKSEKNRKKVLLIGDPNHQFNMNFVKSMKEINPNVKFDFFSTNPKINKTAFELYDDVYNPFIIQLNIPIIRKYWKRFLYFKKLKDISKNYDIAHIQYIDFNISYNKRFIKQLKKISNKTIASIWGSDFFKKTDKQIEIEKDFYNELDFAIIQNEHLKMLFKAKINIPLKINIFGCEAIDGLNSNIYKDDPKILLNIPKEKINITIGYNNRLNQQHIEILRRIYENDFLLENSDFIHLTLPLTYPKDKKYLNIIENYLKTSPFSFTIIKDFLNTQELVALRRASDILIQLQKTDAMSGSMMETLFAGNIVITGSWLPYNYLKEIGLHFLEIEGFDALNSTLQYAIENLDYEKNMSKTKNNILFDLISLEQTAKKWNSIYDF